MFRPSGTFAFIGVITLLIGACKDLEPNYPPTRQPFNPMAMGRYYDPLVVSAALHDMSLADIHFVPHTTQLNDLGVKRLERLRGTLDQYGGTLRLTTASRDKDLIAARLERIRGYLADTGLDMTHIVVQEMMPGGRGMSAAEAIRARQNVLKAKTGQSTDGTARGGSGINRP